jgi:peptidoglycan/LPS O-acetylase OafA/YrhL
MRSLAVDFDLTILAPFLLWLLITLWNSIQAYRWPTEKLLDRRPPLEAEERAAWDWERLDEKRKARILIWFSAIALTMVCGAWLMNDRWKLFVGYQAWWILHFIGFFAFLFSAACAWNYARRQERLKLIACLLAMLFIAASTEHFFHQTSNSGRTACPGCDGQTDDE